MGERGPDDGSVRPEEVRALVGRQVAVRFADVFARRDGRIVRRDTDVDAPAV